MRSRLVHVTNGGNFSVARKVISTPEDFQRSFTMSKVGDLSKKYCINLFSSESKHWKHTV